jgi:hypothetical protein
VRGDDDGVDEIMSGACKQDIRASSAKHFISRIVLAYMDFELDRFVFGRVLNEGEHYAELNYILDNDVQTLSLVASPS